MVLLCEVALAVIGALAIKGCMKFYDFLYDSEFDYAQMVKSKRNNKATWLDILVLGIFTVARINMILIATAGLFLFVLALSSSLQKIFKDPNLLGLF